MQKPFRCIQASHYTPTSTWCTRCRSWEYWLGWLVFSETSIGSCSPVDIVDGSMGRQTLVWRYLWRYFIQDGICGLGLGVCATSVQRTVTKRTRNHKLTSINLMEVLGGCPKLEGWPIKLPRANNNISRHIWLVFDTDSTRLQLYITVIVGCKCGWPAGSASTARYLPIPRPIWNAQSPQMTKQDSLEECPTSTV
jgi:hypothetical protein